MTIVPAALLIAAVALPAWAAAADPPVTAGPELCNRAVAENSAYLELLPYAAKGKPEAYAGAGTEDGPSYVVGTLICSDLTGDGDVDMVVEMECCTGSSLTPWAIFRHDSEGYWQMAYAAISDVNSTLKRDGDEIRARVIARYEGSGTSRYRDRIVSWDGDRFTTEVTRPYAAGPMTCGTTPGGYRITVSHGLTCAYGHAAGNRIRRYQRTHHVHAGTVFRITVRSPSTGRSDGMSCTAAGGSVAASVSCRFSDRSRRGYVLFSINGGAR